MKYRLVDLMNVSKLKALLEKFYAVTRMPSGIVDVEGNIVAACGWRDVCTKFHRLNAESKKACIESDKYILEHIESYQPYVKYKCHNGLMNIGMPIKIDGQQVATLYYGHFFFEEPDLDYFIKQADKYNFDKKEYIDEIKKVPIVSLDKIKSIIELYLEFADAIGKMAEKQLRQIEVNEKLTENNQKLENTNKQLEIVRNKLINKYNEAIQCEKIKTEYFANISHELRTPINVMLAAVQMADVVIENDISISNQDNIKKYTNIIKQNGYRLIKLINNLIDITKIEANYMELKFKNCNIVEVIENTTLSIADYANNKGVELIFDTDTEEKIMACDVDKIERIILNLLSNAIKFTQKGGKITVSVFDNDDKITILVKDTGIGIPKGKQPQIFDRFIQVDRSFIGTQEGSGIGLSIVKSLVEMHNGTIKLISEEGEGSEFIIELPVRIVKESLNEEEIKQDEFDKYDMVNIEFSDIYI